MEDEGGHSTTSGEQNNYWKREQDVQVIKQYCQETIKNHV